METERQLYERGYGVREIAAMRGWGMERTLRRLRAQGFTPRPAGRPLLGPDSDKAQVAKSLRDQGKTYRQIAAALGWSVSMAHKYVARAEA